MDNPHVPKDVLDAAMATPAALRLIVFFARSQNMIGADEYDLPDQAVRSVRSDVSNILAEALHTLVNPARPTVIRLEDHRELGHLEECDEHPAP